MATASCARSPRPPNLPAPLRVSPADRPILAAAARHVAVRADFRDAAFCLSPWRMAHDTALVRGLATALGAPVPDPAPSDVLYHCAPPPAAAEGRTVVTLMVRGWERWRDSAAVYFGMHRTESILVGAEVRLGRRGEEWTVTWSTLLYQ